MEAGIDFVALSFVRKTDDVLRLRMHLEEADSHVQIVAKIEKPEGWANLDAILEESDGVMVARGDLGVEMALEKVPFIQKSIIERARKHGKFVITATQMLESMIENPSPTRAEVSDIANAIYDGTDAVMLSAETSAGRYPVESAKMMAKIALEAEASLRSGLQGSSEAGSNSHLSGDDGGHGLPLRPNAGSDGDYRVHGRRIERPAWCRNTGRRCRFLRSPEARRWRGSYRLFMACVRWLCRIP